MPDLESEMKESMQTALIDDYVCLQWIRSHPFPSLSRGAVVAVTMCIPSGHHSNWVESLAYWQKIMSQASLTGSI